MPRLQLEYSDALRYKEITHRTDRHRHGYVWTPRRTFYRYAKRQMAKVSRRNSQVVIAEAENFDWNLYDALMFQLAIAELAVLRGYNLIYLDEERYIPATRGCHCATCVKLRYHPH